MAEKFQIRIILKNSSEFTVKCDEFNCKKNGLGQLTGISWVGGTKNIPLFLDINEIVAIIQLDTILSADVAPVKHGHWTEIDHSENFGDYHFVCSECKCNTPDRAYVVAPDFCPNCGAKMDGGENNGT